LRDIITRFEKVDSLPKLQEFESSLLFSGKYDSLSAVISVYPGVGGDDAVDWARMLLAMYVKSAGGRGGKVSEIDDETREIPAKGGPASGGKADHVYGFLKKETGVHRLVRISPYDSKGLRHTSFALVETLPILPPLEVEKFKIPESDLKWEFYRSSGPGGQRKNKKETAVRITHLPTGIVVIATEHRLQARNRELAFERMHEKLLKFYIKKKPRIPTRIPRVVKEQRLNEKRKHSRRKLLRRKVNFIVRFLALIFYFQAFLMQYPLL